MSITLRLIGLVVMAAVMRNEKNTRVRYIARPPAPTRGMWSSQAIVLVTPSIGLVTSAPDRRVLHDNRWLSGHRRLRGA